MIYNIIILKIKEILKEHELFFISLFIPALIITILFGFFTNQKRTMLGGDLSVGIVREPLLDELMEILQQVDSKGFIRLHEIKVEEWVDYNKEDNFNKNSQFSSLDLVIRLNGDKIALLKLSNEDTSLIEVIIETYILNGTVDFQVMDRLYEEYKGRSMVQNPYVIYILIVVAFSCITCSRSIFRELESMDPSRLGIGMRLKLHSNNAHMVGNINIGLIILVHWICNILLVIYTLSILEFLNGVFIPFILFTSLAVTILVSMITYLIYKALKINTYLKWVIINLGISLSTMISGFPNPAWHYNIEEEINFIHYINPVSIYMSSLYYVVWNTNWKKYMFYNVGCVIFIITIGISIVLLDWRKREKLD